MHECIPVCMHGWMDWCREQKYWSGSIQRDMELDKVFRVRRGSYQCPTKTSNGRKCISQKLLKRYSIYDPKDQDSFLQWFSSDTKRYTIETIRKVVINWEDWSGVEWSKVEWGGRGGGGGENIRKVVINGGEGRKLYPTKTSNVRQRMSQKSLTKLHDIWPKRLRPTPLIQWLSSYTKRYMIENIRKFVINWGEGRGGRGGGEGEGRGKRKEGEGREWAEGGWKWGRNGKNGMDGCMHVCIHARMDPCMHAWMDGLMYRGKKP